MTVFLVGAGPGDRGLLTVRGAALLRRADVVVYDRLAGQSLLDLAPAGAELVSVAKRADAPSTPQHEINRLLVELGRRHETVVRLEGGDPFLFARGGEEARALADAGVRFEVVPGVTSAIAAPAYAGIPVTLRYSSTSLTVVTGHEDPDKGYPAVDWEAIVNTGGTIVILMGVRRIGAIVDRLLAAGLDPQTPAASVCLGTRPQQTTIRTTIAGLPTARLSAPSTIVIGEVAQEHLTWYENRPLFGRRVVVTRSRDQASVLVERLRELGADPVEVPTIRIVDPADGGAGLRRAVAHMASYDWLVVTSPNGARRTLDALPDARALGGVRVAAIGPATAAALLEGNIVADLVPDRFVAEGLLEALGAAPHDGARVLISRAAVARDVLPDGLEAGGWQVDVVEAYRSLLVQPTDADRDRIRDADTITFTSSSTVTNFIASFGVDQVPAVVACIGPVTAATAREHGIDVAIEADVHTIDGLLVAIVDSIGHGNGR